jgi:hypothetical protein
MKSAMIAVSVVFAATLLLPGCFRERHSVEQVDSIARIRFTGKTSGAEFRADRDGRELWGWTKVETGKVYEAKPGTCRIQVRRGGADVVKRDLLLVEGQAIEIAIP